jgi:hypothetical protein
MDAMEPGTRFSDLEADEVMISRPSRWVIALLIGLALTMLALAALSSERVSAPSPRGEGAIKAVPVEAMAAGARATRQHVATPSW